MQSFTSRPSFLSAATLTVVTCLTLMGCSDTLTSNGRGPSSLSLQLTDAPGDVQHAVVTISEIDLQGSGSNAGHTVLMSTPVTVDLTTLAHATSQLVENVSIPAGTYSQLRFVVTGAYIAVDDGNGGSNIYATSTDYAGLPVGATVTGTLQCPSCAQSGLKVILPNDSIAVSGQQTLLIDFNVGESFGHQAGASGRWIMHPVLKATSVATSADIAVTIQGGTGVTLPIIGTDTVRFSDFVAVLTPAVGTPDTVNFSSTPVAGLYAANFPYLIPGEYSVALFAPVGVTAFATLPTLPQIINVGSGAMDTTAFTLTGVTP